MFVSKFPVSAKGFGILQSFFYEQVHIPSVAVDNHCLVIQQFGQAVYSGFRSLSTIFTCI